MRAPSQDSPRKLEDGGVVEIDHVAEKKLVRKLDLYIIPVTMLLYLLSFLDRYVCHQIALNLPTGSQCHEQSQYRKREVGSLQNLYSGENTSVIDRTRLYGMEKDLGLVGNQFQTAVSLLFVTYIVRRPLSSFLPPS